MRSAFPFFRLAVLVEAEAKIFQSLWFRDMGIGHVDFQPTLSHSHIWLGYFYSPNWLGGVFPTPDLLPDIIPVLFNVITKFFNRHIIHTACPFVGADSLVCGVHVVIGQYLFQQF